MIIKKGEGKETVFLIAISAAIDDKHLSQILDRISKFGVSVNYRDDITKSFFYYAGSTERRVEELKDAFLDKESRFVFLARGGMGVCHVLPFFKDDFFVNNFKPILGLSDLTILLNYIYQKTGKIVYHGPTFQHEFPNDGTLEFLRRALDGKSLKYPLKKENVLVDGNAEGKIIGGNLALLIRGLGTPYAISNTKDKILFLEGVEKSPMWIYDSLWQMKEAGKFDGVKAIIVGKFKDCEDYLPYVKAFFKDFKIPVILEQDIGHGFPKWTIPIGGLCKLDTSKDFWEVNQ